MWGWIAFALALVGCGLLEWVRRRHSTAAAAELARVMDLAATAGRALARVTAQEADLRRDYEQAGRDHRRESAAAHEALTDVQRRLAVSEARVEALTTLREMAATVEQARQEWRQAYETSARTVGQFDAILQQHYAHVDAPPKSPLDGWRLELHDGGGVTESVRHVRNDTVPLRLSRGHGDSHRWYRLTRIEGLALIYTPEEAA